MDPFGQAAFRILLMVIASLVTQGQAQFIYGGEARRVCKAYKRVCTDGKVCALQTINWPQSMKFPVCVYRQHKIVKSNVCQKAPQPGRCAARFTRWYYNIHMQACSWFTYSGCGGNKNNFRSLAECTRTCTSNFDVIPSRERRTNDPADTPDDENDGTLENENGGDNSSDRRRIPVPAPAPEIIDLTNDVTATLSLEKEYDKEYDKEKNDVTVEDSQITEKDEKEKTKEKNGDDGDGDGNDENIDEENEEYEDEDKIAANLFRKLKKQEKRRERKVARERRRREKILRQRNRELRRQRKKERLAMKSKNNYQSRNDVTAVEMSKKDMDENGNAPFSPTRRQNNFYDRQRKRQQQQHQERERWERERERKRVNENEIKVEAKPKGLKENKGRQLTALELGPYFDSKESSPLSAKKDDSAVTSPDPFSKLGRYNARRWLIDERFGLKTVDGKIVRSGRGRGRRARNRRRRRRERNRLRRVKSNDFGNAYRKVNDGRYNGRADRRMSYQKDGNPQRDSHRIEADDTRGESKVTLFDVLDKQE